ncbi:unnamed protein product [Heligmosomoides polygyrus]|uniref:Reverse transcriptase domain-containing protein n=1 Tax=Heligmosomoides polygyrus TaxID=6339 RepID=A0A183G785_HELPZ|nr:unnamed protein product [Heligmosomoides polygyrus]
MDVDLFRWYTNRPIAVRVFVRLRLLHRLVDDVISNRSRDLCEVKRWWTPAVKTEEEKRQNRTDIRKYVLDSYGRLVPAPKVKLVATHYDPPAEMSMTTTTTTSIEDNEIKID